MWDRGQDRRRGEQQGYAGPERRHGERRDDAERRTPGGNEQMGYNEGTIGGIKGEPERRRGDVGPEE